MLKNIVSAYTTQHHHAKEHKKKENHVVDIDHDIKYLLFNKKVLIKFIYKKEEIVLKLRNNTKIVYFIDMIGKLLNFEHNVEMEKIQFLLENKYELFNFQHFFIIDLLSLYKKEITFDSLNKEMEIYKIHINFNGTPGLYNSLDITSVADFENKNVLRLKFFEDWRQATHIMFNNSKKMLKMSVSDSNDLWNSYFLSTDEGTSKKFYSVIMKNKLILLDKKIPCRLLYLNDKKLVMREPIAEPDSTLESFITKSELNIDSFVIQIQGIQIENGSFSLKELYDIFHSPNGFLYICLYQKQKKQH